MKLILGSLALGYSAFAGALYMAQNALIFPAPSVPRTELDAAARRFDVDVVELDRPEARLYGWHQTVGSDTLVLFFHGNAEVIALRWPLMRSVNADGLDFAMFAYRGYPGSTGRPSASAIVDDAVAIYDHFRDRYARIIVYGKSLGGGVAAQVAAARDPAALVLESTFTSLVERAKEGLSFMPVKTLLAHRVDTRGVAGRIDCPVLVAHGDLDIVVGVHHGRQLGQMFSDVVYVEVGGAGHGETLIMTDGGARKAWLELVGGVG